MVKNIEVRGGYMSGGEDEKGKSGKGGTFVVKQRADRSGRLCVEIVPEDKLGAFFRRDWEMCGMPVVKVRVTNDQPTVIF